MADTQICEVEDKIVQVSTNNMQLSRQKNKTTTERKSYLIFSFTIAASM